MRKPTNLTRLRLVPFFDKQLTKYVCIPLDIVTAILMYLPLFDTFTTVCSIKWHHGQNVNDARAAAVHMSKVSMDNALSHHIQTELKGSASYKAWQSAMPSITSSEISRYQNNYYKSDLSLVSIKINQ